MTILVARDGQSPRRLESRRIDKERFIQRYVHENPDVLPISQIKDEARLFVVAREVPTDSGPLDVVGFDADGDLYLIETKLFRNPDKRRVIAQLLDYGAALGRTYPDPRSFLGRLESIRPSLREDLGAFFSLDQAGVTELLDLVGDSLSDSTFSFVVLMDTMDERLRDLLSFVNRNSRFNIYGVEVSLYGDDDLEIMIPRLHGAEVQKEVIGPKRPRWDREGFLAVVDRDLQGQELDAALRLLRFCEAHADEIHWGTGKRPALNPRFAGLGKSLFLLRSDGRFWAAFSWLKESDGSSSPARRFGQLLQEETSLPLPGDYEEKQPSFSLDQWAPEVDGIIRAIERFVAERAVVR